MKILFFNNIMKDNDTGGAIGIKRNLDMCVSVFGKENVTVCNFTQPSKLRLLLNIIFDLGYYKSTDNDKEIERVLKDGPFDMVFMNGPHQYKYIDLFKKKGCLIYLYCHNMEYDYYLAKYQSSKSLHDLLLANYVRKMEDYSIDHADIVSSLNQRDAKRIKEEYDRDVDFILPIGMSTFDSNLNFQSTPKPYGLYVGSNMHANVEGMRWFIKEVAPYTNYEYWIVGGCCSELMKDPIPENVILKGKVENLDQLYINASFVINPVFSGSGMKTKTIEGLRYGKSIIGTQEAFEGINADMNEIGCCSDDAEKQIAAIASLDGNKKFNVYSKNIFEEKYSYNAVFKTFKEYIFKLHNS